MTSTSMMAKRCGKLSNMHVLKAKVVNGRFVIYEPTELPEDTELYLVSNERRRRGPPGRRSRERRVGRGEGQWGEAHSLG